MNIRSYGTGERLSVCHTLLKDVKAAADLHLLPIPTTKDGKTVFGTDLSLDEFSEGVCNGDIVAGYGIPREYFAILEDRGAIILDLSENESFLEANAHLTAIGAVGHILTSVKKAPTDLVFGIIGYGRIGKSLLRLLLFLGARVTVYTSNRQSGYELCTYGVEARSTEEKLDLSKIEVLFNTAPAKLIAEEDIPYLPAGIKIIDLASGDYVKHIPGVLKLPSVPERLYPISGGRLYANAVLDFIKEIKK